LKFYDLLQNSELKTAVSEKSSHLVVYH